MITIQKLPSLEPEMRGALRSHIMRKRQRLKQAEEQDAIEKRMKKEREQKRIQDAMTLDQIKEQLSTLEKRLETLRSEKHNLFVQLKQVLNEGSSKRKQASESNTANTDSSQSDEQTKRPKIDDEGDQSSKTPASDRPTQGQAAAAAATPTTIAITTATSPATTAPVTSATTSTKLPTIPTMVGNPIETITSKPIPMSLDSRISELNLAQKTSASHLRLNSQPSHLHLSDKYNNVIQPPTSSYNPGNISQINSAPNNQHSNELRFGLPPVPLSHAHSPFINNQNPHPDMINFSRHDNNILPPSSTNSMSPQQLAALQSHFRGPFAGAHLQGQIPPELLMASRLDPSMAQRFGLHNRLPLTSMSPEVSMSLAQQAEANRMLSSLNNLPRSNYPGPLDVNGGRWDERTLMALKKGPGGASSPFHPSQLLGVDGSFPPSMAHLNFLNQAALAGNLDPSTSIGQSMLSSLSQNNPQSPINFNPRRMLPSQNIPRSGVDFMLGNIRSGGMLIPNLGPIYTSQQSGTPPTSMFGANGQLDMEHLNALYNPSQHMPGSMAHFNNSLAKQQQHLDQQQHLHNLHQHQQQQQQQQQEQASRLFSSSNPTNNYHRKPAPKNPYR